MAEQELLLIKELVDSMANSPKTWQEDEYRFQNNKGISFWKANGKSFFRTDKDSVIQLDNAICQEMIWPAYQFWREERIKKYLKKWW